MMFFLKTTGDLMYFNNCKKLICKKLIFVSYCHETTVLESSIVVYIRYIFCITFYNSTLFILICIILSKLDTVANGVAEVQDRSIMRIIHH